MQRNGAGLRITTTNYDKHIKGFFPANVMGGQQIDQKSTNCLKNHSAEEITNQTEKAFSCLRLKIHLGVWKLALTEQSV